MATDRHDDLSFLPMTSGMSIPYGATHFTWLVQRSGTSCCMWTQTGQEMNMRISEVSRRIACFCSLFLALLFYREDGGDRFLRMKPVVFIQLYDNCSYGNRSVTRVALHVKVSLQFPCTSKFLKKSSEYQIS